MSEQASNTENVSEANTGGQIRSEIDDSTPNRKLADVTTQMHNSTLADADKKTFKDAQVPEKNGNHAATGLQSKQRYQQLERGIRIIRVKERHGQLRKAVPIMPLPVAVCLCIVNCILPGIGTFLSGFAVFCGSKTEIANASHAFWLNVATALLQIVTLPIIVGWIWSIIWGVAFITSAMNNNDDDDDGGGGGGNVGAAHNPDTVPPV